MPRVGRAVLPVLDLDEAIAWYGKFLGFRVLFDADIFPGFRSVHIGPSGTGEPGIWLFPTDSRTEAGHPSLVLYSDDLDADAAILGDEQIDVVRPFEGAPESRSCQIRDPWGNVLVIAEDPR